MTIESENGKHTLEMSDQACKDLLAIWGIDMKKFAKNFLDIKQNVQRAGKWNFRMTHSLSDGGDSNRQDSVGRHITKLTDDDVIAISHKKADGKYETAFVKLSLLKKHVERKA